MWWQGPVWSRTGIAVVLVVAFELGSLPAYALPSCAKNITDCGCAMNSSGTYTVNNSIASASTTNDCLVIAARGVVLNLQGNDITGPVTNLQSPVQVAGIRIKPSAPNAIVNGGGATISQFTWGILGESRNANVSDFTATADEIGVLLVGAGGNQINSFDADSNVDGMVLTKTSDNVIDSFDASSNSSRGVLLAARATKNQLSSFTASDNGFAGIGLEQVCGSVPQTVARCGAAGPSRNLVESGTADSDGVTNGFGIWIFKGHHNKIEGNTASKNGTDLSDSNPHCDSNVWKNNTFVTSNRNCIH